MATQTYTLPLDGAAANDTASLARLLRENAALFNKFVMSEYPEDMRYAYQPETFDVTAMDERHFTFRCMIHYFEPCCDRNMHDPHTYTVPYEVRDNALVFTLDETPWTVA
ncbi:hypothetical protein ACP26E_10500 [Franconibacter pulveris 601]|uniref:hypothetical protein n=1 Tax=Franconibacter TaxID=1649295 RepID=UPI00046300BF|nr:MULTISPECIES: hypothetical protein [Franconibacter]GGD18425.1 hypothetical protein GCM10011513_14970 [Franconibacter daqui]